MATASRSLEFSDGSSNKFWNIELNETEHTVTFGKIGTSGQSQTKSFDSEAEAKKSYDKLVAEKTKKGYVDKVGSTGAAPSASTVTATKIAAKPKATKAKSAAVPAAESSSPSTASAEPVTNSDAGSPAVAASAPAQSTISRQSVDLATSCEIDLSRQGWALAKFREQPRLKRGVAAPFDKDNCLDRLSKIKSDRWGYQIEWSGLKIPPAISREEALFWIYAFGAYTSNMFPANLAEVVRYLSLTQDLTIEKIALMFEEVRSLPSEVCRVLANYLTIDQYLELCDYPMSTQSWRSRSWKGVLLRGIETDLVPYLTDEERQDAQNRIRKNWDPTQEFGGVRQSFPSAYYAAAALGMHDEVYQVISRWNDGRCKNYDYGELDILRGLGSKELVASEWRRLEISIGSPDNARAFVACTEDLAVDLLADAVVNAGDKDRCDKLLNTLCLVRSPLAAVQILRCKLEAKAPSAARDWLDKNIGRAVYGLMEMAGQHGKLADATIEYLRTVKQKGFSDLIEDAMKTVSAAAASRVQTEVLDFEVRIVPQLDDSTTPPWLKAAIEATGKVKPKAIPGWASPALLPPLCVGDRRLSDEQTSLVLQLLLSTPLTTKHSLIVALRENLPKNTRDEFAWGLFRCWKEDGYPSKDKWAMGAIGHLGDDGCVLKLTPMIRIWPGESQHARAVFGLECLRAIGSSVALMQLSGIAQKLKFKGLKTKAEQFVTEIAKERGLTREELEDRVVPDCGLDEQGQREFSFGPRSFSFVLTGDLKPMVRDEAGKLRPNPPDPNAKDDQALATESLAEWKLIKKQIKDVATIQAGRLEQSMVTGRRWRSEDFESLLVRHPLMTHLVQKLIWAGFDANGKRVTTFRVTEEKDYADPEDNSVSLEGVANVGVVHTLEMTDAERECWGQVMGDYEIISPFPQLGRPSYTLEPGEEQQNDIQRFSKMKLAAPTLVFGLEKMGWIRGVGLDGGGFDEHSKQFPAANVTAVACYTGEMSMGYISPDSEAEFEGVYFCQGMRAPSGYGGWSYNSTGTHQGTDQRMLLKDVPPIVISEVLADMQVLKSKAK